MASSIEITREQVIAYRTAAHGLHRDQAAAEPTELAVFDLGVQDSVPGAAATALAARLPGPWAAAGCAIVWSFRGAPHLHRRADLPDLIRAYWPRGDADAVARLARLGPELRRAGIPARSAFEIAARAWRQVAPPPGGEPIAKGAASAAITELIPDEFGRWCSGCGAFHVHDQLMRVAALPAGVALATSSRPATFVSVPGRPPIPAEPDGTHRLVEAYLRLHGPATVSDAAGYLGTTGTELRPAWPDGLVAVRSAGRRAWLPEDRVAALRAAPPPPRVRLLAPHDPYLQGRDRTLLVPDEAVRKQVWRLLGNPGAVLVRGEVGGVWRAKASGRRIALTIQPFDRFPTAVRADVEAEAERVAVARGASAATVTYQTN